MKKVLAIISLVSISSTLFASPNVHCVRGGGVNTNLPFHSYHLSLENNRRDGFDIKIFERTYEGLKGDLVLKAYVEFVKEDQMLLRSVYSSKDGRIDLTVNKNRDGQVLSAWVTGTGEGLDRRRAFAFEGRSCMQVE